MSLCHATCVVVNGCGVLIRGPSGSGKSDLALRLIDEGALLLADDYCLLSVVGERITAACPNAIKGKLEVRGIGIVTMAATDQCTIDLVVDLKDYRNFDRLPESTLVVIEGVSVACFSIDPFSASATAKVRAALAHMRHEAGGA